MTPAIAAGRPGSRSAPRRRRRHELRRRLERGRRPCTLCLFDADGDRDPAAAAGAATAASGTASCRASAPGRPTATGPTGPCDPARGMRCNPAKLLLDPYARAIAGDGRVRPRGPRPRPQRPRRAQPRWTRPRTCPAAWSSTDATPGPARRRPAPPRCADTVVYEVHVKGSPMRHPDVPAALRGTYAGLAHDAALAHLVDLGVTTVELLPVHHNVPEPFLVEPRAAPTTGATTPIGFFAPHAGYSAAVRAGQPGGQVAEFRDDGRPPCTRAGPRGAARRRVQPHRRGRPARPDAVLPRSRQRRPTTASTPPTAALRRHHGLRQLAQRRATRSRCS